MTLDRLSHLKRPMHIPTVTTSDLVVVSSPFSGNSKVGHALLGDQKVYCKVDETLDQELAGLRLLLGTHYATRGRYQSPIALTGIDGLPAVIYPWLDYPTVAHARLDKLARRLSSKPGGGSATNLVSHVLNIARQRAEDMTLTYEATLHTCSPEPTRPPPAIHRFYLERLLDGGRARLTLLHPSFSYGDKMHDVWDIASLPLCINGQLYPSLRWYLEQARSCFARQQEGAHLVALGHGDLHLGNILAPPPDTRRTAGDANPDFRSVTIDYGTFGYHSPWLDIAKPMYMDSFGPYFYADLVGIDLEEAGVVQFHKDGDTMVVHFRPFGEATPEGDCVGRALMDIMVTHIVKEIERLTGAVDNGKVRVSEVMLTHSERQAASIRPPLLCASCQVLCAPA